MAKNFSEKAKLPKICPSFGGSMPEAKIKQCLLTPPSNSKGIMLTIAITQQNNPFEIESAILGMVKKFCILIIMRQGIYCIFIMTREGIYMLK